MNRTRPAFTIVELLALVGTTGVLGAAWAVTFSPGQPPAAPKDQVIREIREDIREARERLDGVEAKLKILEQDGEALDKALGAARATARQLKDATQVRGIVQSFVIWAQNNQDRYPLLSLLDKADNTVAGPAEEKDTTANIFSVLVFNGFLPCEMLVSTAEANANIQADDNYEFNAPKSARKPDLALWDPAFSADFTDAKKGNVSFAHMQPSGGRLSRWSNTFDASEPVVGNRGPQVTSVERDGAAPKAMLANDHSNTFLIHGARDSWEGNIGYQDAHVNLETRIIGNDPADNAWPHYETGTGQKVLDCIFFDEPDDSKSVNAFLAISTKSGKAVRDWKSIWD